MVKYEDERAFPVTMEGSAGSSMTNLGMTLRDYFAAKAMPCAFNEFDVMDCGDYHHQHELVAELAYAMADAMLAERAK